MFRYIQQLIKSSKNEFQALRDIWLPLTIYQTIIRMFIIIVFSVSYYFLVFWILKNPETEQVFITGMNSLDYIHIDRLIISVIFYVLLVLFSFFIETFGVMSIARQYYLGKKVKLRKTFYDIVKYFNTNIKVQILKYAFILFNILLVSFLGYVIYLIFPNIFGVILGGIIIIKNTYIVIKKIINYKDVGQKVFEGKKDIFEIYGYKIDKKRRKRILKFYICKIVLVFLIIILFPFLWLYISKIITKYSLNHTVLTSILLGINAAIAIIIATILSYLYISFFTLRATRVYLEYKKQKANKLQKYRTYPFIKYKKTIIFIIFLVFSVFQSLFYYLYFEVYILENKNITIFAHRASKMETTNNSLSALNYCIKSNVEYVEIDVQLSKEGIPVVFHDYTYFDGKQKKYVHNTSLRELKMFDLVSKKNTSKKDKEKIPTLEEFLQTAKGKIKVNIEIKTTKNFEKELALETAKVIKKLDMEKEVMVTSFDYKILKMIKTVLKEVETGLIIVAYIGELEEIRDMDVDWLMINDYYYYIYKSTFEGFDKKIGLWSFSKSFDGIESLYENISGVIIDNPVNLQQQIQNYNKLSAGEKYYQHIEYIFFSKIFK